MQLFAQLLAQVFENISRSSLVISGGRLKTREWKTRERQKCRVEIVGVEIVVPAGRGRKRGRKINSRSLTLLSSRALACYQHVLVNKDIH